MKSTKRRRRRMSTMTLDLPAATLAGIDALIGDTDATREEVIGAILLLESLRMMAADRRAKPAQADAHAAK